MYVTEQLQLHKEKHHRRGLIPVVGYNGLKGSLM